MPLRAIFFIEKSDASTVDHAELIRAKRVSTKENLFCIYLKKMVGLDKTQQGTELLVCCIHCERKLHGAFLFPALLPGWPIRFLL